MRIWMTIFVSVIICKSITAQPSRHLSTIYNKNVLETILVLPTRYQPVPTAKQDFWRDSIPRGMQKDYIKLGEQYKGKTWDKIPLDIFAEYKSNGNRTNFENRFFAIRKQLSCLVMAEIMEHQGRFTKDIIDGLKQLSTEIWWGVPAHYPTAQPKTDNQVVELFSAETANLVAWTLYMLHDELEMQAPGISTTIRQEIQRRILIPALTNDYEWKKSTSNWNPWICSNWLSCILLCEDNRQKQIEGICQILQCLDVFYSNFPDDGSNDEGIMYWDRSSASFFECLYLLGSATSHHLSLSYDPKLKNMGAFYYNIYIGNRQFVNFSDAQPKTATHPNISIPFGLYTNDSTLVKLSIWRAHFDHMFETPSTLFLVSGNFPTLSRELLFLYQYPRIKDIKPEEPHTRDIWLPDLQVSTARSTENSTDGLFIAVKGGHNGESHNHNDVGNFIIYKDAEPLIIDIGVGTYTAQTFSDKRYELFNCRSAYHNVPIINGIEQHAGAEYKAEDVTCEYDDKQATFRLNLSKAYPQEASIKRWTRTIRLNRGKNVTISEDYQLMRYKQPTSLILICCEEAKQTAPGIIAIGKDHHLHFDDKQLSATIEPIKHNDALILRAWNNKTLYRILLTIKGQRRKGFVKYIVQ